MIMLKIDFLYDIQRRKTASNTRPLLRLRHLTHIRSYQLSVCECEDTRDGQYKTSVGVVVP